MKYSARHCDYAFEQASLFPVDNSKQHWLYDHAQLIKNALQDSPMLLIFNPQTHINSVALLGLGILPSQVRIIHCAQEKISAYAWQALANTEIGFIVSEQEGIFEARESACLHHFKLVA